MPQLEHANHVGLTHAQVSDELRFTTDTITVVYDAGWPGSRPATPHVIAVGHTSAPAWLTAADVWFEAV